MVNDSIQKTIMELDAFFSREDLKGAEEFLKSKREAAAERGDWQSELSLVNEELGFYRRMGYRNLALTAIKRAIFLTDSHPDLEEVTLATILLNTATTMKAFGDAERAMPLYKRAMLIYERKLPEGDHRFAGLFNNMAGAYEDLKKYETAETLYKRAINILKRIPGTEPEIAVTYVNLAQMYYNINPEITDIYDCLDTCREYLEKPGIVWNENYAYTLRKCAPVFDFFGYFAYKNEITKRADNIYEGNC